MFFLELVKFLVDSLFQLIFIYTLLGKGKKIHVKILAVLVIICACLLLPILAGVPAWKENWRDKVAVAESLPESSQPSLFIAHLLLLEGINEVSVLHKRNSVKIEREKDLVRVICWL